VLVYRAGTLAALGHDHVIACRCLAGAIYLPADPLGVSFELRLPVARFSVDDPALRRAQHSGSFPPEVPRADRQGTRRHMLGAAQLNAARFADITLRSESVRPAADGSSGDIVVRLAVQVAGRRRSIAVPIHYALRGDEIEASGDFPLRQSDLGLTPYSVLGGALRVRDRMQVRFRLLATRRR
jgi:polyisoprenoid-binding protein YceI